MHELSCNFGCQYTWWNLWPNTIYCNICHKATCSLPLSYRDKQLLNKKISELYTIYSSTIRDQSDIYSSFMLYMEMIHLTSHCRDNWLHCVWVIFVAHILLSWIHLIRHRIHIHWDCQSCTRLARHCYAVLPFGEMHIIKPKNCNSCNNSLEGQVSSSHWSLSLWVHVNGFAAQFCSPGHVTHAFSTAPQPAFPTVSPNQ